MKPKEIQKLIELVEKSSINELEVSRWGRKVRIQKQPGNNSQNGSLNTDLIAAKVPTASVPLQTPSPAPVVDQSTTEPTPPVVPDNLIEIRSPMIGTFYRAPSPDSEPYIKEGDKVTQGQVLCIVEAMKLMNEIEAEFPCKIVEINIENAQPVEYDQVLFKVEKA